MSNPTRQEIIDAYEMLDVLLGFSEDRNPDLVPERRHIIEKALPPRPQPTMAEIEWDDDRHYLAEAENPAWGKVLMLGMSHDSKEVTTLIKTDKVVYLPGLPPQSLTPTGKRYTLTEVQE